MHREVGGQQQQEWLSGIWKEHSAPPSPSGGLHWTLQSQTFTWPCSCLLLLSQASLLPLTGTLVSQSQAWMLHGASEVRERRFRVSLRAEGTWLLLAPSLPSCMSWILSALSPWTQPPTQPWEMVFADHPALASTGQFGAQLLSQHLPDALWDVRLTLSLKKAP